MQRADGARSGKRFVMVASLFDGGITQIINDGIAANIKDHPDRFVRLGTVPLQDTALALKELDRVQQGGQGEREE